MHDLVLKVSIKVTPHIEENIKLSDEKERNKFKISKPRRSLLEDRGAVAAIPNPNRK